MAAAPVNLINVECRQCRLGEMQFVRSDRSDRRLVWTFRCSHEDCGFEETAAIERVSQGRDKLACVLGHVYR